MGRPLALLAAAASLAALLLGGALAPSLEPALRGASRLALAALPWIALSGLPAGRRPASERLWPRDVALALPALALGAWLDGRAGSAAGAAAAVGGVALLTMAVLGEASHRASARPAPHALAWALLVAVGPLFGASLGRDPAPWLTRLSPVAWIWGRARIDAAPAAPAELAGPVVAGALLLLVASLFRAGSSEG